MVKRVRKGSLGFKRGQYDRIRPRLASLFPATKSLTIRFSLADMMSGGPTLAGDMMSTGRPSLGQHFD